MNLLAILKVAFRALGRNKLRTALTMLGIVIGVGAVIVLVSIGQGAQSMVLDQISSMGSNMIFVMPGNMNFGGASMGLGAASTLTDEDVFAMEREIPTIAAASPVVNSSGQMVFGNQNWFVRIQGTNEKFPRIREWKVEQGEFFTDADVRSASRVVVLGKTVSEKLFPGIDPIGQTIRVRNLPFRVVGVLAAKGQSMVGQDQDDTAVMPYTTVQRKLLGQQIPSINQAMVSSVSQQASAVTQTQIAELLRQRHKIPPGQPDDFFVRNMTDAAQTFEQLTTIMTLLLGSIAAISLVVGGIGIMNIMLVSVTERTREIGIRMAVGARPNSVRLQFLMESVTLSLMGGLIGVIIGGGLAAIVSKVLGWPTLVSAVSVLISFAFATIIGVFFGYYPAHKAAALDPIEALRYE
ncbi:MAG: multidrug ABC transporter substrate-binding protein [Acidobacteria bacterium]|nr:MAG: multidrug ABC transporter substrate-binding protein [Acidobacteriota bacterium]